MASGQPFYVFYLNPEENTIRRFEIQGFGEYYEASNNPRRVHVFVDDCSSFYRFADNVEDLNVNDQTLLKSSIYAPYVYNEESEEEESDDDDYGRLFRGNKKRGWGWGRRKRAEEDIALIIEVGWMQWAM